MVGFNDGEMRKGDRNQRWHPRFPPPPDLPLLVLSLFFCPTASVGKMLKHSLWKPSAVAPQLQRWQLIQFEGLRPACCCCPHQSCQGVRGASSIEGPLVVHTVWFVWRLLAFTRRFFFRGSRAIRSTRPGRRWRPRVHRVWFPTICWDETLHRASLAVVKKEKRVCLSSCFCLKCDWAHDEISSKKNVAPFKG